MSDTISRKAAIDAICEDGTWLERQGCTEITMAERKQRDVDILSALPSFSQPHENDHIVEVGKKVEQPEPCEDAVSRRAVIDIALQYCPDDDGVYSKAGHDPREMLDEIEALPSAQPERTCVNCGRTANNGGWYADGRTRCPIEEHYALPKDGYCHLWEKRNVTDDDYPERREE